MARVWVEGYKKDDGTKVKGHYREKTIGKSSISSRYIDAENALAKMGYKRIGGDPYSTGVAFLGGKKQKAVVKSVGAGKFKSVIYK
jgi:hypothetical protein